MFLSSYLGGGSDLFLIFNTLVRTITTSMLVRHIIPMENDNSMDM